MNLGRANKRLEVLKDKVSKMSREIDEEVSRRKQGTVKPCGCMEKMCCDCCKDCQCYYCNPDNLETLLKELIKTEIRLHNAFNERGQGCKDEILTTCIRQWRHLHCRVKKQGYPSIYFRGHFDSVAWSILMRSEKGLCPNDVYECYVNHEARRKLEL